MSAGNPARCNIVGGHNLCCTLSRLRFIDRRYSVYFPLIQSSPRTHDAYAVWRLPAFRRYFAGNMILMAGWQMQKVAIGWEVYEPTHSAMSLGYAGLVQCLPQLLIMRFAGDATGTYNVNP